MKFKAYVSESLQSLGLGCTHSPLAELSSAGIPFGGQEVFFFPAATVLKDRTLARFRPPCATAFHRPLPHLADSDPA